MNDKDKIVKTTCCRVCGECFSIHLTKENYKLWKDGERIQDALPELTLEERELLISGICDSCFPKKS